MITDIRGVAGGVKLGLEFFSAQGPSGVSALTQDVDLPLFLDVKFHDIPNTVAGAVRSVVAATKPRVLTIHASGGAAMMRAAQVASVETADELGVAPPAIVGVTVLTSLDDADLDRVGQKGPSLDQVRRLAALAVESGLAGVVCSPFEVAVLRADLGDDALLVVPGIRPSWAAVGDQKRVMTPAQAQEAGADIVVTGRPVTEAEDRRAAAQRIVAEMSNTG
ncbi:MAG: orotidine-5'-phosphate decarboxylase [Alphaproteobacteria bacterium]|nr:orotidine-5'-phosphate decarboxylase [Alphaproteobacteria bacterium]